MNVRSAKPAVAVIGAAHVDHVAQALADFTTGASNPGRVRQTIGGAGYNAAMALRAFGASVTFLGVRGGDAAGERVAGALEQAGIADRSATWLDRATPSYTAILDAQGELHAGIADMSLYETIGARLLRRRAVRDWLSAATAVLTDANLPAEALQRVARATPARLAAIGVSPAKVVRLAPILPRLDALFLSRREAMALTGLSNETSVCDLTHALGRLGVRRAVVTDGPRPGAILDEHVVWSQVPPPVAAVVDVTGAGDTLAGITLLGWIEGQTFLQAARVGLAAASLRVTGRFEPGCRADCEAIAATLPLSIDETGHNA